MPHIFEAQLLLNDYKDHLLTVTAVHQTHTAMGRTSNLVMGKINVLLHTLMSSLKAHHSFW